MNERMIELAKQAGLKFPSETELSLAEKKFAKLIVQECIDKVETYRIPVGNSAAGELACGMTYDALKEIRDDIKEHFGVEE